MRTFIRRVFTLNLNGAIIFITKVVTKMEGD